MCDCTFMNVKFCATSPFAFWVVCFVSNVDTWNRGKKPRIQAGFSKEKDILRCHHFKSQHKYLPSSLKYMVIIYSFFLSILSNFLKFPVKSCFIEKNQYNEWWKSDWIYVWLSRQPYFKMFFHAFWPMDRWMDGYNFRKVLVEKMC